MNGRIDSHQHFWKFDPVRDTWIDNTMSLIRMDFSPKDLLPLLKQNGFEGCVAVQASQTEEETNFLLHLAEQNTFIKGVVGWVNLLDENICDRLEFFSPQKKLKGFRHVVQAEPDGFMQRDDFQRGIKALRTFNYTYDLLIVHYQLSDAIKLVNKFFDQPFVLDHIAKPAIRTRSIKPWAEGIKELAKAKNVCCKVSGMVTEAHWEKWEADDLKPYLDIIFENFTSDRIMFGSDWPVCNLAASYSTVVNLLQSYICQLPQNDQDKVWNKNARAFYKLDI